MTSPLSEDIKTAIQGSPGNEEPQLNLSALPNPQPDHQEHVNQMANRIHKAQQSLITGIKTAEEATRTPHDTNPQITEEQLNTATSHTAQ